ESGGAVGGVRRGEGLNSNDATLGSNLSARQIQQLPMNERAATNLLTLQPGVASDAPAARTRTSLSDAITQPDSGVQAEATGGEVGDLFEYRIDQPVT